MIAFKKSDKSPGCVSQAEGCLTNIPIFWITGAFSLSWHLLIFSVFFNVSFWQSSVWCLGLATHNCHCVLDQLYHQWLILSSGCKKGEMGALSEISWVLSWFLCSNFQCFTTFWKPFRWKHVSSIAGRYDTVNSSHGWQDSSWDCRNWWHLDGNETKGKLNRLLS